MNVSLAQQMTRQDADVVGWQRTERWIRGQAPPVPRLVPVGVPGHSVMIDLEPLQRDLNRMSELWWVFFLYPGDTRRLAVAEAFGL